MGQVALPGPWRGTLHVSCVAPAYVPWSPQWPRVHDGKKRRSLRVRLVRVPSLLAPKHVLQHVDKRLGIFRVPAMTAGEADCLHSQPLSQREGGVVRYLPG